MNLLPGFDALGLPAPLWLLFGLKVFGFWLHLFFMNLWLAGLPVALLLARKQGTTGEAGARLLKGMPIFIALGINAGIVPLLFLQVLYPQFFYTSTILQAWPWFAVLGLVLVAYYAVYAYVLGINKNGHVWRVRVSGWLASILFLMTGLIFVSEMQLLTRPGAWAALASESVGGAVKGSTFALNADALLRFVMMVGIALGTTATYLALDANFLRRGAHAAARDIRTIVLRLALIGTVVFGAGGVAYISRIGGHISPLTGFGLAAALGPTLVLLGALLYVARPGRALAGVLIALQLVSLLANAIARQLVQFREIAGSFDVTAVPVNFQISPVVLFVVTLVIGLGVVGWLVNVFVRAGAAVPVLAPKRESVAAGSL